MAFNYTSSAIILTPDRIQFKSSTQRTACIDIPVFIALSKKNNYLLEKNTDIIRIREIYNKKKSWISTYTQCKKDAKYKKSKKQKKRRVNLQRYSHATLTEGWINFFLLTPLSFEALGTSETGRKNKSFSPSLFLYLFPFYCLL